jgi:sterol desaturase/sphingolipid hydroxylase (fatty acid hydroxylase superfamily)
VYSIWLLGISLVSLAAERLWPWRKQKMLRRGVLSDLIYIVFNSEYLGILIALGAQQILRVVNVEASLSLRVFAAAPLWAQFLAVFFVFDFIQWSIHNLLHRVPVLWRFHKVHHSVVDMDWLGDWRFHWGEVMVYRTLLYAPTLIAGVDVRVLFWYGIVNTIVGHYAHANVRLSIGPLRYFFNTPQMHIWHHTHPDCGPVNVNFGITLSLWDWLFGTAYLPARPEQPARLGFEGIEQYPQSVLGQWFAPFRQI